MYDGVGRQTAQYAGYDPGETTYAQAGTVEDDTILEQTETDYDAASNVIQLTARQRYHNASASQTGPLADPSTDPKARVTYTAHWDDAIGREIATAACGTNGGTALARPNVLLATFLSCHSPEAVLVLGCRLGPIFDAETGDLFEINVIAREDDRGCFQTDTGNAKIHGADPDALLSQFRKPVFRLGAKRNHIHLAERSPDDLQFAVRTHHVFRSAASIQVGHPSFHKLVETDDRGRDVVCRILCQPGDESIALRLASAMQDRQVVGVEQEGHRRLLRSFGAAKVLAETNDFRVCLVPLEFANDPLPPRGVVPLYHGTS